MTHLSDGTYMVIPDLQVPLHDQDGFMAQGDVWERS